MPAKVYAGKMKKFMSYEFGVMSILLAIFLLTPHSSLLTTVYAQIATPTAAPFAAPAKNVELTYSYSNVDPKAVDGDILFSSTETLVLADSPYSNRIFGVLQENPLMVYRKVDDTGKPVSRNGIAKVNVTTVNGPIFKGDHITSSGIAGKGQKAFQSGNVLGIALENFTGEGAQTSDFQGRSYASGKIAVALRIEYAEIDTARSINRLLEYVNASIFRNIQDPEKFTQVIRYIAAALIVLIAFAISFITFSRAVAKGIEGVGRNPLAKNAIQFTLIINAALTAVIALIGVIASFLILRL